MRGSSRPPTRAPPIAALIGFEGEALALPGVHQGFALPDRESLFEALGDVAAEAFRAALPDAARRDVVVVDVPGAR